MCSGQRLPLPHYSVVVVKGDKEQTVGVILHRANPLLFKDIFIFTTESLETQEGNPQLPHGAGLILLSKAWFPYLAEKKAEVWDRFLILANAMGVKEPQGPEALPEALAALRAACGMDGLRLSDFGITKDEFPALADNARTTMGMLFDADRFTLSQEECVELFARIDP